MSQNPSKKRSIQKAWGLKVGDLVYKCDDRVCYDKTTFGKILKIWENSHVTMCDVYWFDKSYVEKDCSLSTIRHVKYLSKKPAFEANLSKK